MGGRELGGERLPLVIQPLEVGSAAVGWRGGWGFWLGDGVWVGRQIEQLENLVGLLEELFGTRQINLHLGFGGGREEHVALGGHALAHHGQ